MKMNEYQELAMRTAGISNIVTAALGLCEEAGEFAGLIKKHKYQGHPFSQQALEKELGDILWYIALAAFHLNTDLECVALKNIEKLQKRYPNGFEEERSRNRGVE